MADLDQKLPLKSAGLYASPRRESAVLPLVYGDMTQGGVEGLYSAVCVDTENYIYALAGHPLLPLSSGNQVSLYGQDGQELDSGSYSLNLEHDLEGQGAIATASFNEDQRENEPISVRAKGKADEQGDLLEDPLAIIRDALLNVAGLDGEQLEPTSFSRAQARSAGLGFKAAGVLGTSLSAADFITGLLGCFLGSWWQGADGRLKVFLDLGPGAADEAELARIFRQPELKSVSIQCSLDDLVNQASALYCLNYTSNEYESSYEGDQGLDQRSISLHGSRPSELELAWVRDQSVAALICGRLINLLSTPRRLISFQENALSNLSLEKGDAALLSLDWLCDQNGLPLVNQIVRVLGMEPQLDKGVIRFSVMDTGLCKTLAHGADGSSQAGGEVLAGGERDRRRY